MIVLTKLTLGLAGLLMGSYTGYAVSVASLPTGQPKIQQSTIKPVAMPDPDALSVYVYELQGGTRQTIQVTARNRVTPQPATVNIQGNDGDTEYLQPAMAIN